MPIALVDQLGDAIEEVCASIACLDLTGQTVDQSVVDWYKARFEMFVADGAEDAIDVYLRKVQDDESINMVTKMAIYSLALEVN